MEENTNIEVITEEVTGEVTEEVTGEATEEVTEQVSEETDKKVPWYRNSRLMVMIFVAGVAIYYIVTGLYGYFTGL